MLKKIIIVLLLIWNTISLMGLNFNNYPIELMQTISIGKTIDKLGFNNHPPPDAYFGPSSITINKAGYLYICDTWNGRIVMYNNTFRSEKEIKIDVINNLINLSVILRTSYGDKIYGFSPGIIDMIDENGKHLLYINLNSTDYAVALSGTGVILFNNIYINYLTNNDLICIPYPGIDNKKNLQKILNSEQTKKLLKEHPHEFPGITIDEKNRIFINGEFIPVNYDLAIAYWEEKHKEIGSKYLGNEHIKKPEYYKRYSPTYLGKDNDGNIYYDANYGIVVVFNKDGWLIDAFDLKEMKTYPAVHPSGDIYFLNYTLTDYNIKIKLCRVKNVWDPEGRAKWYSNSGVKDLPPISQGPGKQIATITADGAAQIRDDSGVFPTSEMKFKYFREWRK